MQCCDNACTESKAKSSEFTSGLHLAKCFVSLLSLSNSSSILPQGPQKGSAPHGTGSTNEGTLSHPHTSNYTAPVHPNNQVGHSADAPSPQPQPHNHLPSPPSLPHSSTSGGAAPGASATKDSNTPATSLGNGGSEGKTPSPLPSADGKTAQAESLANHVHSEDSGKVAEGGEKPSLSADNPRLSALLAGGKGPQEGEGPSEGSTSSTTSESHKKINNIHPAVLPSTPHAQGSSAASSPISAMSTATPSPKSSEHTQTGAQSPATTTTAVTSAAPAVNGNSKGGISEDSQSPLKAEPPAVSSLKATPPHGHSSSSSSSSSSISIYPSSTDVLKACR